MIRRIPAALALLAVCLLVDLIALVWMTVAFIAGSRRGWRLALAQDQLGNALAGGDEDEVFSSRCYRMRNKRPYCWLRPAIDAVAGWLGDEDHCRQSWIKEEVKRGKGYRNAN